MHPILFSVGPFKIYSYGLFMAMGLLVTIFFIEKKAAGIKGISAAGISHLCLIVFIFALLGARLMYILTNLSFYRDQPLEILMLHHGGLMFHGGIIIGLIAAWWYLKKSKLPILSVLDIVALYLPIGQAIGRIGCLLNGCCFGRESTLPWAIRLVPETVTRHPAQIYASIGSLIIFIILRLVSQRMHQYGATTKGTIFSLYLILYPINRIVVEGFRADLPRIWMGLSLTQLLSVVIFICGMVIWKKNLISQS